MRNTGTRRPADVKKRPRSEPCKFADALLSIQFPRPLTTFDQRAASIVENKRTAKICQTVARFATSVLPIVCAVKVRRNALILPTWNEALRGCNDCGDLNRFADVARCNPCAMRLARPRYYASTHQRVRALRQFFHEPAGIDGEPGMASGSRLPAIIAFCAYFPDYCLDRLAWGIWLIFSIPRQRLVRGFSD
jgi:hypothetical protein